MCALLRRNVLDYTISKVIIQNDPILFPAIKAAKEPTDAMDSLRNSLKDARIKSVGRHGKYFWLRLGANASTRHDGVLLMHFGMTGMIKLKNVLSHLIFMENGGDKKVLSKVKQTKSKYFKQEGEIKTEEDTSEIKAEEETTETEPEESVWPPKFTKFEMELQKGDEKIELAFVDPRRLGRINYFTGPEYDTDELLLQQKPLSLLGPDYSKPVDATKQELPFETGDPDPNHHGRPRLAIEEFSRLILSKKKPIKSLLLDQQHFAGVGNWVGDEIVYRARIHPNEVILAKITKSDDGAVHEVVQNLYDAIIYVCQYAVSVEGDVTKFPDDWLMLYRWGKGRKSPKAKLKSGHTVDHVTIGGRTSCFVPDLQKPLKKEPVLDLGPVPKRRKT